MTPDLIAGRYRVVRAIGRGGMGTVWLCRDEILGREVAVKQIGMLPGESATDAARALREARSSAALNHRNVVSVFDIVDSAEGHAWLVMEYVPSRTLGQITREEGPLDPRRAAWIGAQVADGLAAAHAVGTIHRDVKPGNILVGEKDDAKISDFGIARGAEDAQLTRTGLVTGTPSYFSPELARGEDPGAASDVYALGATLYSAVEGRPPYPEERNAILLLQKIAAGPPPPPTRAGPLAGPLGRMMDREPGARWRMSEAATALHRIAEGGDVGAERTAVLTAPAPVGWEREEWSSSSRPAPPPEEDRTRRRAAPWLVAAAVLLLVALGVGYMMLAGDGEEPGATNAASQSATPGPTRSRAPTPTPTPTPSQTPTQRETDPGAEMKRTVEEYFSVVPEDTDTGWSMLAPSMQAQGRDAYEEWWGSVDSVELHDARPSGDDTVDIALTYHFTDGSAKDEVQRLTMQESGGDYLIADDEVLRSETVS